MKVRSPDTPPSFKPITIEITFESKQELDALYLIANISGSTHHSQARSSFVEKPDSLEFDKVTTAIFGALKDFVQR